MLDEALLVATKGFSCMLQPNGQVLAVTETVFGTFGIDVSSLDTVERKQFRDKLKGDITTAHPSILPNGDLVNFVTNVKMSSMVSG